MKREKEEIDCNGDVWEIRMVYIQMVWWKEYFADRIS